MMRAPQAAKVSENYIDTSASMSTQNAEDVNCAELLNGNVTELDSEFFPTTSVKQLCLSATKDSDVSENVSLDLSEITPSGALEKMKPKALMRRPRGDSLSKTGSVEDRETSSETVNGVKVRRSLEVNFSTPLGSLGVQELVSENTEINKNSTCSPGGSNISVSGKSTPSTSRYQFRLRTPLSLPKTNIHDSDSSSDGDFSIDEDTEWRLDEVDLGTSTSRKKKAVSIAPISSSDSEAGSDTDSILGGVVTVSKKICKKSWLKKLSNPRDEDLPLGTGADEDVAMDDCPSVLEWEEGDIEEVVRPAPFIEPPAEELREPVDYFNYFFDDTLVSDLTKFTNSFSVWKSQGNKSLNVTTDEMRKFLGIWILMGVVQLPSLRDYWTADTKIYQVASTMPFNRFQNIRAALHLYEKSLEEELDQSDRYRKVATLLNHIRDKCNGLAQENEFSIDETIIPYKGTFAGSLRQYIKSKPHKFGFKVFSLAGKSGIIYDFIMYAGASTFQRIQFTDDESKMGLGAQVVIHLSRAMKSPAMSTLYFDNFFSSVKLLQYLKEKYNILCIGTVRSNRIDQCPLKSDKELQRAGRGSYDSKVKNGVQVIKWVDNKIVHVVSTIAGVQPEGKCQRFDKSTKQRLDVPVPRAVELYNSHMGGVDLHDMLVELHRVPTKARRWYVPIIGYMIDLAVVNSWLVYRRHAESLKQTGHLDSKTVVLRSKQFRVEISKSLQGQDAAPSAAGGRKNRIKTVIQKPRGFRPDSTLRFDSKDHFPDYVEANGRCKFCPNGSTRMKCVKCDIYLCLVPKRNCFWHFHHK